MQGSPMVLAWKKLYSLDLTLGPSVIFDTPNKEKSGSNTRHLASWPGAPEAIQLEAALLISTCKARQHVLAFVPYWTTGTQLG